MGVGKRADPSPAATAGGLAALVIWSTTVAVARSMAESLGVLTGAALATGAGGAAALVFSWLRGRPPKAMLALPPKYLLGCGGLFVVYEVCLFAGLGWAPNRSATLVVGLLNYLWPVLTVLLSIPILERRARWPAAVGCLLAVAGTAAAVLRGQQVPWQRLAQGGPALIGPLLLGAAAGVTWALYSNLVKRWGRPEGGAVPLFLLASGAALGLLRLARGETTTWTAKAAGELCLIAVAQSALAYPLWEAGMRRGRHLLLSLASYFVPVASLSIAAAYLWVRPGAGLIVGCVLVTGGAVICKYSVADE